MWCSKKTLQKPAEETACTVGNRTWQQEASNRDSAHQWEKPVVSLRQRGMKPQREDAGGGKSKQYPSHPQPQPSNVQSAVWCVHQESDSTAINEHARTYHQPFQKSSSLLNPPSYVIKSVHMKVSMANRGYISKIFQYF